MSNKILIFRTDRIGDLIFSCPSILTIKDCNKDSDITLICSNNNYEYAKKLNIFKSIHVFPSSNILKKIKFIFNLSKTTFEYIFIFDGKDRSIISSLFIKSKFKVGIIRKINLFHKIIKIKFFKDEDGKDLNATFQNMMIYCNIKKTISNYNFLSEEKDNSFSLNIPIKKYIHIHLDEKWFSDLYIKEYTSIDPKYDLFIDFINNLSEKKCILITTGVKDFPLINDLKNIFFEKITDKVFLKKNFNNSIYFVYKPTFSDIESLLRNTEVLISCHGSITHASNSFNIRKIDIIEKSKEKFYQRFTFYVSQYNRVFRSDFPLLKDSLNKLLL